MIVPASGVVTSPWFVSAVHFTFTFATVSRVVVLLVEWNMFGNGGLNSGSSADAEPAPTAPIAPATARHAPSFLSACTMNSFRVACPRDLRHKLLAPALRQNEHLSSRARGDGARRARPR